MNTGISKVASALLRSVLRASAVGLFACLPDATPAQDWPQSYRGVWGGTQVQPPESSASYLCILGGGLRVLKSA